MIDTHFYNGSTNNNNYDSFDSYLEKYKGDKLTLNQSYGKTMIG